MRLASFVFPVAALALLGCPSVTNAPDAAPSDDAAPDASVAPDVQPDVQPDVHDAAPFVTAAHDPLPVVRNWGGPIMAHPRVVVVTYADDPNRAALEADAAWLVSPAWLPVVGGEYGIGAGTVLANVELTAMAPTMIDLDAIESDLLAHVTDGTLPGAVAGQPVESQPLYVLYFPQQTTVTETFGGRVVGTSCHDFGGFHYELDDAQYPVAFAVINACPDFDPNVPNLLDTIEEAASHELIEAATDPAIGNPAFVLSRGRPDSPWTIASAAGELGDLCSIWPNGISLDGFYAQRVWSNRAAASGNSDPCVPSAATTPFYFTTATPDDIHPVAAGASAVFTLQGWSSAPVANWSLQAIQLAGDFMAGITVGATTLNNGRTTTLTVAVPDGTPPGQTATIAVYSGRSRSDYTIQPVTVVAN